jgi:nitrogenase-associated protein
MAEVWFYEKPGCVNNTRQKKLLIQSGHQVISQNLLEVDWSTEDLRAFFGDTPVVNWFNYSAPAIKDGWIEPDTLNEMQAINLMRCEPLLIRRPLMRIGENRMAGFEVDEVDRLIGLTNISNGVEMQQALESCPQQSG